MFTEDQFVSGSEDKTIRVYDLLPEVSQCKVLTLGSSVHRLASCNELNLLAAGLATGQINLYDTAFNQICSISAHENWVAGINFIHGKFILSSGLFD